MVRVPWNEPGIIGKVLDGGAWGVICPMVNTPARGQGAGLRLPISAASGKRSNGPIRAGAYGEPGTYQTTANDEVLVHPDDRDAGGDRQYRSHPRRAQASAASISDRQDLGLSSAWRQNSTARSRRSWRSTTGVIAECAKRKIFAAVHTGGAEDATKCIARGFRLVTLTNDVSLMAMAARGAVAQTRKESKGVA